MGNRNPQLPALVRPVCYDPAFFLEKAREALQWLNQHGETGCQACANLHDPWQIDPEILVGDGILTPEEWNSLDLSREEDPEEFRQNQDILLTMAYERSNISANPEYQQFLSENSQWLEDCALFLALDRFFAPVNWRQWPEDIRCRYSCALDYYRRELYFDAEFQMYLQFLCYRQKNSGTGGWNRTASGI